MRAAILHLVTALTLSAASVSTALAAELDINGIALGTSADQIIARFQEARPEAQYEFVRWKLPEGSEWVANGRTLYNDLANPDDMEHERMQFAFTGLGSGNKLFAASRELKFRPSQRPMTESVYAAAVQKFGEPSVTGKSATGIWAAWKFGSADAKAEKLESPLGCIGISDFPVGLDEFTAKKAKQSASMCGIYVDFVVRGDQTGLANELEMKMMDQLHLAQDFDADNSDARKRIDAAKSRNATTAAPAPKL
ncbi:hypothetical protein [Rhizobium phaseoli]|uniref:hypothetical protein n=1 Tax=Rhizobium phaseoli TaxID=396 RepID=UPI0007EBF69D|nr:hypothetical protein [Rhizobium phaseoli]ANL42361.1 hypothetical protein AMC88_CH04028 [Rhizobium phaseoli]ANL61347.1 hypothetical protein AMC85_CH04025 [Rhizobium phaseoli]